MNYLIDGHNLIGKMPDIHLPDEDDEARLTLRLLNWAAVSKNNRAIVVFDRGLPGPQWLRLASDYLKVIFVPEGRSADQWLITFMRQQVRNPQEYILVSSDRALRREAEARRIKTIPAEDFAGQVAAEWAAAQAQMREAPAEPPPDPRPTADDVAEWLQLFGGERHIPIRHYRPAPPPAAAAPAAGGAPTPAGDTEPLLTPAEVAEWLALFGGEPERKKTALPKKGRRPAVKPPAQPSRPADPRLSPEDIDLWRSLFGDQEN